MYDSLTVPNELYVFPHDVDVDIVCRLTKMPPRTPYSLCNKCPNILLFRDGFSDCLVGASGVCDLHA